MKYLYLLLTMLPALAACADGLPAELVTDSGTLYGTLTLPESEGPVPVYLIIAGSGPTDRDGNSGAQVHADSYRHLAEQLAERGVATLRYDKRGIAASAAAGPDERALRFDTYIDDAAAWLRMLAGDSRFSRVGVIGHSEGALIAAGAARQVDGISPVISLAGAGRRADLILEEQIEVQAPELLPDVQRLNAAVLRGDTVLQDIPEALASIYRPSVLPYMASWYAHDPATDYAALPPAVKVAIIQGANDIQVSVDDARLLKQARPSAFITVVPDMAHTLKPARSRQQIDQLAAYIDPTSDVRPTVIATIVAITAMP